jgi:uncharacterized protein
MKILTSHISDEKTFFDLSCKKEKLNIPELAGDVRVEVTAYRSGVNYKLNGRVSAGLNLTCDRCLENYIVDADEDFEVVYSTEENVVKDEHLMPLSPYATGIDLLPYIRETLILSIPVKKLCSPDCKGLCPVCGTNLNYGTCNCKTEREDPRWDKLKELKKTLESAEE